MELRNYGEDTTLETRSEAQEGVDKSKRYSQITECLLEAKKSNLRGLTAKECAVMMMQKGYVPTSERNVSAPRLTEMMYLGKVEPIGKTTCEYTGKKVTVYALTDGQFFWEE